MELNNNGVNNIEQFMNYIFKDLFIILNENTNIKEYQALKKLEKTLNTIIMDKINLFKKDYKTVSQIPIDKNDEHLINYLLKEKYIEFENEEYPFYQHVFYSKILY